MLIVVEQAIAEFVVPVISWLKDQPEQTFLVQFSGFPTTIAKEQLQKYLRNKLHDSNLFTDKDADTMLSIDRDERGKVTGTVWLASKNKVLVQRALWMHGTKIELKTTQYDLEAYLTQYTYTDLQEEIVNYDFEAKLAEMTLESKKSVKESQDEESNEENAGVDEEDDYGVETGEVHK